MGNGDSNVSETDLLQLLNIRLDNPGGPMILEFRHHSRVVFESSGISVFVGKPSSFQQKVRVKKLFQNEPTAKVDSINNGGIDRSCLADLCASQ